MGSDRSISEKPLNYDATRVLVGNWFENRHNYTKNDCKHFSTYDVFFTPKKYSATDPAEIWTLIFRGEGRERELLFDHDGHNYNDNYASTYDLSYYHLPKFFRACPQEHPRNWYPEKIDLTLNYGPITNRGLRRIKQAEWRTQRKDPRVTQWSSYHDQYPKPNKGDYPSIFHIGCHRVPGQSGCDPITWECDESKLKPKLK